ncbi:hypothetical protein [Bifidobacterium simiarum]|uniref:Growth inhibitor PemK n=1 Tax=Bifidobacterium simiarum TaxID=2045441 RepID=A0A2M9HDR4_9BIFI|nr:hypothetical protein [Bifidobacterium simiarum]PJM74949.1 hypothetical protein CSQ87_06865 [Bifidobacterium simiarum]
MKRGEIWTLQADGYDSKPRPVVIVHSDTVDRKLLGYKVGVVDDASMTNIGRQLMRVLGLL